MLRCLEESALPVSELTRDPGRQALAAVLVVNTLHAVHVLSGTLWQLLERAKLEFQMIPRARVYLH